MGVLCYNRKGDNQLVASFQQNNNAMPIDTEEKKLQKDPNQMQENQQVIFTQEQPDQDGTPQKNKHNEHTKQQRHQFQFQNSQDSQVSPSQKNENSPEKVSITRSTTKRKTVIDKLYVCYALYHLTDVTPFVFSQVRGYDLNMEVNPEIFGLNKSKKKKKNLNVWIWENLGLTHYQAKEGETLTIHREEYNIIPLKDIDSGYNILSAVFGDQDVTEKVQQIANSGVKKIQAQAEILGVQKSKKKRILVVLSQIQGHKNIIFRQCEEGAEISFD